MWEGLLKHKQLVIEPKESAQFRQAFEDYKKKLDDPTTDGCIMFSVLRGKVMRVCVNKALGFPLPMQHDKSLLCRLTRGQLLFPATVKTVNSLQ